MVVEPDPETFDPVTSIVSTIESSDDFLITIFPLSASTASLKVRTILSFTPTFDAPSAGEEEDRVGTVTIDKIPSSALSSLSKSSSVKE